ncbi:hypothetical protein AN189_11385 [Loktanella sp. 3ANDIMAR09]|uniref:AAA family ATPase n=1 Tax=Loktanella sp. 3ANDIMAR09 TaxID=1225657 RepID=UPI0006F7726E|nr:adenylate/guanylate cyclase domain-containing protein [Loktanella sp. 3ANDIMAR09]KQI68389.1 hypothetical protein AN189_11385 [Loktanella sp. 3ANDIMAR09]
MTIETADPLVHWLHQLGLGQYAQAFADHDVTLDIMPELTGEDLTEIGVKSVGHRRRLLTAAKALCDAPARATGTSINPLPDTANAAELGEGAEQRIITAMFCDLVGSTRLSTLVDPEEYRDLIAGFRQIISDALVPYDGHVARFLGDGIVVFFGLARAQDHSAENAVAAALDIIQRIARDDRSDDRRAQVRIGIATGLTIVNGQNPDGDQIQIDDTIVGEIPNLAARLQAAAAPDTVLVSQATRDRLGDLFRFEDFGLLTLKGIAGGVQAWRAIDHAKADSRFEALRSKAPATGFVGRASEMAQLMEAAGRAAAGQGQVSLIMGDAGMGKSRLARELLDKTRRPSAPRLFMQCTPYHRGTPFHPIRRSIIRLTEPTLDRPHLPVADFLAQFGMTDPEQVAMLSDVLDSPAHDQVNARRALEQRTAQITMLTDLFCAMAQQAGTIILEDMQWIDASTIEVLSRVATRLDGLSAHLLATMRMGEVPQWCELARAQVLVLDRLPPTDFNELVRAIARANAPHVSLSDDQIAEIAIRCDGSPVFAEELTRFALDRAAEHPGAGDHPLPATLADSLLSRLDRLETGRELAQLSAVIGSEFPVDLLIDVSDLPKSEVLRGVSSLIEAGVLRRGHSPFGPAVGFRHMLLKDAAYLTLLRRDRINLHARIARTMTQRFPELAATVPQIVAHHLSCGGDLEGAVTFWDRAGSLAAGRSAYSEAIVHFRRAIEDCAKAPAGADLEEAELAVRIHLVAALVSAYGFNSAAVHTEMPRVEALGAALKSTGQMLPLLISKWVFAGASSQFSASLEVARQIEQLTRDNGEAGDLLANRCLGTSHLFCGNLKEADRHLRAFFETYEAGTHDVWLDRFGSSHHGAMSAVGLAELAVLACDGAESQYWSDMARNLSDLSGQAHDLCHCTFFLGCVLPLLLDEYEVVQVHADQLRRIARAHQLETWEIYADLFDGTALMSQGQLDKGCALADASISRIGHIGVFLDFCMALHAEACVRAGLIPQARKRFQATGPTLLQQKTWLSAEFGRIDGLIAHHENRDPEQVRAILDRAQAVADQQGVVLFQRKIAATRAAITAEVTDSL